MPNNLGRILFAKKRERRKEKEREHMQSAQTMVGIHSKMHAAYKKQMLRNTLKQGLNKKCNQILILK